MTPRPTTERYIAETLARFATSTGIDDVSPLALDRARMCIASTVASAAMGASIASTAIVRSLEMQTGGAAQATVWFNDMRLPMAGAARVNAMASDAAASDDSDLRGIAHIGTIVSTTALAAAQTLELQGRDVLRAMVLGYEVAGRVEEALTPGRMKRGFHGSVATVLGGAVATGLLLDLDATAMTHAIALAATSIGGLAISADTSWAREYHAGLSAMLSVNAAMAAKAGFRAEPGVLDGPRGFIAAMGGQADGAVTRGLGESWDIVTDMAIKLMPGAHPFHAIAEAAAEAAMAGDVAADRVDSIMVSAPELANFRGPTNPTDLVGAAHSLVYFVAAAVRDRGFHWEHMEQSRITDAGIQRLMDRVEFSSHETPVAQRFPFRQGGTVTVVMNDGQRFTHTCRSPRGSGTRGVEWADVDQKYRYLLSRAGVSASTIESSLACIRGFDTAADVSLLSGLLGQRCQRP